MNAIAQARAQRRYVKKCSRCCATCVFFRALNTHGNNVCSLDGGPTPKTACCKEFIPRRKPA